MKKDRNLNSSSLLIPDKNSIKFQNNKTGHSNGKIAYMWIDTDSGHVEYCEDPEGRKTELNPLMGYVSFTGPRDQIYKKYLKFQRKPCLIEKLIKL